MNVWRSDSVVSLGYSNAVKTLELIEAYDYAVSENQHLNELLDLQEERFYHIRGLLDIEKEKSITLEMEVIALKNAYKDQSVKLAFSEEGRLKNRKTIRYLISAIIAGVTLSLWL